MEQTETIPGWSDNEFHEQHKRMPDAEHLSGLLYSFVESVYLYIYINIYIYIHICIAAYECSHSRRILGIWNCTILLSQNEQIIEFRAFF